MAEIKAAEMRSSGIGSGRVRMHITGRCSDDDGFAATSPGTCGAADVLATEINEQDLGPPVQDSARLSFTTCQEARGTFDRGTFGTFDRGTFGSGGTLNRGTFGRDTFGRAVNSVNRAEPVSFKRFSFHAATGGTPTNEGQDISNRPSIDICDGDEDDLDLEDDGILNDMAMFYEDTSTSLQNILNERREKKDREAKERESAEKKSVPTGDNNIEVQRSAWTQGGVDRATFTAEAFEPSAANQYEEESREPDAELDLDAHCGTPSRKPSEAEPQALMQETSQLLPVVVATTTSLLRTLHESGGLPSVCTSLEQKAEADGEPQVGDCCKPSAGNLGNERFRSESITSLGAMSAPVNFPQQLATTANMQASSRQVTSPTKEQLSPTKGQVSPTEEQVSPTEEQVNPTEEQVNPTKEQLSFAPAAPTAPAPERGPRKRTNPTMARTLLENRNIDGYAPKQQEKDIQMKQLPVMNPSEVQHPIMKPSDVRPSDVTLSDFKPSDVKPSDAKPSDVTPIDVKLSEGDQLNVFIQQMMQQIALSTEAPGRRTRNHADVHFLDAHFGSHKSKSDEWEEASLCYSSHSSDGEDV